MVRIEVGSGCEDQTQPRERTMTIDRMDLEALIEKAPDADFLREMIAVISNRLMQMEVENLTGAAHGERSAARTNHRNGYRDRQWETRVGSVDLDRGRDGCRQPPPAQIRTCPIKAYGSYRRCLTRKRCSGHGCITPGMGSHFSTIAFIRRHVSRRPRWLRLSKLRYQRTLTRWRTARTEPMLVGTAK